MYMKKRSIHKEIKKLKVAIAEKGKNGRCFGALLIGSLSV